MSKLFDVILQLSEGNITPLARFLREGKETFLTNASSGRAGAGLSQLPPAARAVLDQATSFFRDIPDAVISLLAVMAAWQNRQSAPQVLVEELQRFAGSVLKLPKQISETVIAFCVGSDDLVDRMADLVEFKAKGFLRLLAAVLRGDAVSLRKSLDERFVNDCKSLLGLNKPNAPEYLTALIAICYGNTFRASDLSASQTLQSFAKDKIQTAGCINLLQLSMELLAASQSGGAITVDRQLLSQAVVSLVRVPTEASFVLAIAELNQQKLVDKRNLMTHLSLFFAKVLSEEVRVSDQVSFSTPVSNDLFTLVEVCMRCCLPHGRHFSAALICVAL